MSKSDTAGPAIPRVGQRWISSSKLRTHTGPRTVLSVGLDPQYPGRTCVTYRYPHHMGHIVEKTMTMGYWLAWVRKVEATPESNNDQ